MKFQFSGEATIAHINARKEGPDDSKELAVDLKLEAITSSDVLLMLGDGLSDFLFLPGGSVRNIMLGPLEFLHEIEHYRLDILGSAHYGCKVKKIKATPIDGGGIKLVFGVSFKPTGNEVARIAEFLQDSIEIGLFPSDGELDLNGEGAKDARA